MIKAINFLGSVIVWLATFVKMLQNLLKFFFLIGFGLGVLMLTFMATFEALHFVQPVEYANQYGMPLDIFAKDLWAWIVAILGWTTMGYGIHKMFEADKEYDKDMAKQRENRNSNAWLEK